MSDERDFNAEAFFTITAPDEETAKEALAVAVDSIDEALRHIGVREDFPEDCTVILSLEDTQGGVEES